MNFPIRVCLPAVFAGLLASCSSPTAQRAQRADGLLDFLAGNPGETNVPVELVSGGGGRITTGQVRAYDKRVFVTGLVERQSVGNPPAGSHVDVLVLDARRKVVERVTVRYSPRDIPHGQRGRFPQSHYTARLTALPPPGSTVEVRFHGLPESRCALAMNP